MRTRTSNRTKRFTVEKYDFEVSSEEEEDETALRRRQKRAEDDDQNFDEDPAAAGESPDDEDVDEAASDSDGNASNAEPEERDREKFYRQNVKRIQPFNLRATDAPTTYLPVEVAPPDGHLGKAAYAGPYERGVRSRQLVAAWYGGLKGGYELAWSLLDRWMAWTVLPPKETDADGDDRVWMPEFAEKEAYFVERLAERLKKNVDRPDTAILSPADTKPYQLPGTSMPVLMGAHVDPQDVGFKVGDAHAVSQSGLPFEDDERDDKVPTGWLLDTGGIPIAMSWRPNKDPAQILAIAVIPHHDQELYNYKKESAEPDFQKYGIVQLWEFHGEKTGEGFIRPSSQKPTLRTTLCLDRGRARRVKWSPACGYLAIICGDGEVCVIQPGDGGNGTHEKLHDEVLILQLTDEPSVKATAMTWITFNRIAIGYSDGSIGLWSIHPRQLLSRLPLHHTEVVDMASGYPTMPYLLSSIPIGGNVKLIDLASPSYETTEVQTTVISVQPNLLAYSDHLLGFFTMAPSGSPLNTTVGFMHHAHFPQVRRLFTGECFVTCLAVGRTHPFLLVGASDGALWAMNPQVELFSGKREPSDRLKVFQHEHRPKGLFAEDSPAKQRGASRVLHGFKKDKMRMQTDVKLPGKGKGKKPGPKKGAGGDDEADPTRGVVHEPLTRITVVDWNPNGEYGCWAAAATASGLVRVIDLGLEVPVENG